MSKSQLKWFTKNTKKSISEVIKLLKKKPNEFEQNFELFVEEISKHMDSECMEVMKAEEIPVLKEDA